MFYSEACVQQEYRLLWNGYHASFQMHFKREMFFVPQLCFMTIFRWNRRFQIYNIRTAACRARAIIIFLVLVFRGERLLLFGCLKALKLFYNRQWSWRTLRFSSSCCWVTLITLYTWSRSQQHQDQSCVTWHRDERRLRYPPEISMSLQEQRKAGRIRLLADPSYVIVLQAMVWA